MVILTKATCLDECSAHSSQPNFCSSLLNMHYLNLIYPFLLSCTLSVAFPLDIIPNKTPDPPPTACQHSDSGSPLGCRRVWMLILRRDLLNKVCSIKQCIYFLFYSPLISLRLRVLFFPFFCFMLGFLNILTKLPKLLISAIWQYFLGTMRSKSKGSYESPSHVSPATMYYTKLRAWQIF